MSFLLLALLQPQQPRLSPVVIVGAVLAFIAGVSLLVYFYRRYKRTEKEPEEDWDMSRRSLFVHVPPPEQKSEETSSPVTSEVSAPVLETQVVPTGGTREFASESELAEPAASTTTEPRLETGGTLEFASENELAEPASSTRKEPPLGTAPLQGAIPSEPEIEPSREAHRTELLASLAPKEPVKTEATEQEPAAFDEEVWAGLELDEQQPLAQEESSTTAVLRSAEPPRVARVDERSHREPFEPPLIERIEHREPYESPRIEPLTPREQAAATRELRSPLPPQIEQTRAELAQDRAGRETGLFGSIPQASKTAAPAEPPRVASETLEMAAEPSLSGPRGTGPSSAGSYAPRASAGSVLGLPTEPSYGPLILGDIVRRADETGIGALSNYGKDVGPKGGRGGTIALLAVVVLLGGAVLLYLFVPSVHSRVQSFVAQVRGTDTQAAREAAMKPKVQIIPSYRPEVNKNMVTARGAVDNISDEPLENLSIEVSLQRGGDTPPEIRNVPVVPNPLPTGQRGTFQFEYDGKRDTGFTGYKITRVFSNGTEVKFRAPGKK